MSLRLRLRMPSGQSTFSGDTFSELAAFITTTASLASFELLTGFPPVLCEWNKEMPLSEKLRSGDTLVVRAAQAEVAEPPRKASPPPMAESAQKVQRVELDTEDAELQAALAMSLDTSEQQPPASQSQPPAAADDLANGEDAVVRRIIPADNSCLFNAVAYALEGRSKAEAPRLRELIASSVQTDGGEYSEEAVLGQSPASYAQWIRNPEHWGGGIELAILSAHYATEMAAFDVQTQRADIFGQGCGYKQRILLLYDGIHVRPAGSEPTPYLPRQPAPPRRALSAERAVILLGRTCSTHKRPHPTQLTSRSPHHPSLLAPPPHHPSLYSTVRPHGQDAIRRCARGA